MGIVRKQSLKSSIISYIGAGIGFVNKGIIFTNLLDAEQVGLANMLVSISVIYAQFSALGYGNIILRFFPYFRAKEQAHHGFLGWALLFPFLGFALVTGLLLLFKDSIIGIYQENSPLLTEYFFYLLPLGLSTLYYVILDSYLRSLFKTVVPFLLKEVVQRLFVTLSVTIFALGWVDFPTFVMIYVILLSSVTLLILAYVVYLGQFKINLKRTWRIRTLGSRMMWFGAFSFLSNITTVLIQNIDALMLAELKGMYAVGIYTTSFFITSLILIPWRAMAKITLPLIAEYWKSKDLVKMHALYKRTSLLNFIIGAFLFLGIWVNHDFIFAFMKPEFASGVMVLLFIGLGRVFDMVTGLNGIILLTSRRYAWDLFFTVVLVALTIYTNRIFIPIYGLNGAALATLITLVIFNGIRVAAVQIFFKMNPFSGKMLFVLIASGLSYGAIYLLPSLSLLPGLLIRSSLLVLIFGGIILGAKVSPDINKFLASALKRIRG